MSTLAAEGEYRGASPIEDVPQALDAALDAIGSTHSNVTVWEQQNKVRCACGAISRLPVSPDDISRLLPLFREVPMSIETAIYCSAEPDPGNSFIEASLQRTVKLPESNPPLDAGHLVQAIILHARQFLDSASVGLKPNADDAARGELVVSARSHSIEVALSDYYRETIAFLLADALASCGIEIEEGSIDTSEKRVPARKTNSSPFHPTL